MDRSIVFPGQIPLETHILQPQRDTMIALGALLRMVLGTEVVADGLLLAPTVPASMTVVVGPGSITRVATVDGQAFGSLPADASPLIKQGIKLGSTPLTLVAPATPGHSITYLIQAAFSETDSNPVVLPYYNAANPSVAYSGPGNSNAAQNTQRRQGVQIQLKAGAAAPAGSQQPPAVDAGWSGLYRIVVNAGQTAITAANLAGVDVPGSPTLDFRLPDLRPGFSRGGSFGPSGSLGGVGATIWTVPDRVRRVRVRAWGGGGGGGGAPSGTNTGASGAGGGGYCEGVYETTPGAQVAVIVGRGGRGGAVGTRGESGQATVVSDWLTADGGAGGPSGATTLASDGGGAVGGNILNVRGLSGYPASGTGTVGIGGGGGHAHAGAGGHPSFAAGYYGQSPGGGGGGGGNGGVGGDGGAGIVILEW